MLGTCQSQNLEPNDKTLGRKIMKIVLKVKKDNEGDDFSFYLGFGEGRGISDWCFVSKFYLMTTDEQIKRCPILVKFCKRMRIKIITGDEFYKMG